MKTTGEKIKSLRIALGLSQEQLSETIDVAHKSIYRYETGKSLPDTTTLVKLATYFDVSTDYLLGLSGLKIRAKKNTERFVNLESITKYISTTFRAESYMILITMRHTFGSFQHGRMGRLYMADRPSGVAGQTKLKQLRFES